VRLYIYRTHTKEPIGIEKKTWTRGIYRRLTWVMSAAVEKLFLLISWMLLNIGEVMI